MTQQQYTTNESAIRIEVRRLYWKLGELLDKLNDKSALQLVNYAVTSALYVLRIEKELHMQEIRKD